MTLTIPDEITDGLLDSPEQVRLELAVGLYAGRRITRGRGAEIAGISYLEFQQELGRREIPVHYGIAEYEADCRALDEVNSRDRR